MVDNISLSQSAAGISKINNDLEEKKLITQDQPIKSKLSQNTDLRNANSIYFQGLLSKDTPEKKAKKEAKLIAALEKAKSKYPENDDRVIGKEYKLADFYFENKCVEKAEPLLKKVIDNSKDYGLHDLGSNATKISAIEKLENIYKNSNREAAANNLASKRAELEKIEKAKAEEIAMMQQMQQMQQMQEMQQQQTEQMLQQQMQQMQQMAMPPMSPMF